MVKRIPCRRKEIIDYKNVNIIVEEVNVTVEPRYNDVPRDW